MRNRILCSSSSFFLAIAVVLWALSWIVFGVGALLTAYLFLASAQQFEYSKRGFRLGIVALWNRLQEPNFRLKLCVLTGCGVTVTRVVVWSAVTFFIRNHPNGIGEIVGAVVFPEIFVWPVAGASFSVVYAVIAAESLLVTTAFWLSLLVTQRIGTYATRTWPHLENKIRLGVLRWRQKP